MRLPYDKGMRPPYQIIKYANNHEATVQAKDKARKIVAKELNEMDGFSR